MRVAQGKLGLPDYDYKCDEDKKGEKHDAYYQKYAAKMLTRPTSRTGCDICCPDSYSQTLKSSYPRALSYSTPLPELPSTLCVMLAQDGDIGELRRLRNIFAENTQE